MREIPGSNPGRARYLILNAILMAITKSQLIYGRKQHSFIDNFVLSCNITCNINYVTSLTDGLTGSSKENHDPSDENAAKKKRLSVIAQHRRLGINLFEKKA